MTRVVLVTGLGGAGRTTVAAATALAEAWSGARVLLLAADGTADADTVLGTGLGDVPREIALDGEPDAASALFAARVDVQDEFQREFLAVQDTVGGLLGLIGVDPLDPEEIVAVPGAVDALALRVLARHAESDAWDTIVVDLPPVDRAAVALALPEALSRYVDRLLPVERQAARALRPMLAAVAGVPMPDDWVYATARRVVAELDAVRALLDAPGTGIRFVTRAGAVAAASDRRAAAALALFGRRVEDVVVNGVREAADGGGSAGSASSPGERVTALRGLYPEAAVHSLAASADEPIGPGRLAALGVPGVRAVAEPGADDLPPGAVRDVFEVETDGEYFVLVVPLPGAERGDLDLLRRGDELVVTVGAVRRLIPLPSALRRCTVQGAGLRGGTLRVRFLPDPAVWMRS
ncbi:ArsA family ATPase [Uniformispora flossi]|uniref:ArsA family ATPase n=1 Tax=Uniformispora flossi TaxID=3390723 RepID=UPI003C2B1372